MSPLRTFRIAFRSLIRARWFSVSAALTLGLGIGLATAVLTVADALLLRRLPVVDQERLVVLAGRTPDNSASHIPLTLRHARTFATDARTLDAVAYVAYEGAWPVAVRRGDDLTRLRRALVSGNYFAVMGARPVLGRDLGPADDVVGAPPVAVISNALWAGQFGSDPDVLGRRFTAVEFGTEYVIVGVMPGGLEYPLRADFWAAYVPARLKSEDDPRAYTAVDLVARLGPDATADHARDELTTHFAQHGGSSFARQLQGTVTSLPRAVLGDTRPAVLTFAAAAALLLLITCINVANLLLVRGLDRTREIAVHFAIGASRRQVMIQLMVENALLAIGGGVIAGGVAAAAVRGFLALAPPSIPLIGVVRPSSTALGGALGITAIALLLFGLAPALVAVRGDMQSALRSGTRHGPSRRSRLARETLVAAQVSLAVLMLSAAALIGRSFRNLDGANLEFDPARLVIAELAIRFDQYPSVAEQLSLLEQVLATLESTPGVEAVSPVVAVPFSGAGGWDGRAALPGQSVADAAANAMFNMELVTPDYFATFAIPLIRGRSLAAGDVTGAERVVVVSESLARRYWPGEDPIGKVLRVGQNFDLSLTVVGLVRDTRYRDLRDARPTVYFPLAQSFFPFAPTTVAIRTGIAPDAVIPVIRTAVNTATPGVVIASASSFDRHRAGHLALPKLNAFLLALFAGAAVLLAAIGLAGVMATTVRQRRPELGVRMALGATTRDILALVMGRGLVVSSAGVGTGLLAALAANRWLASLLYGVSPTDAVTLLSVTLLLLAVGALATWFPARRAAKVEPVEALRGE